MWAFPCNIQLCALKQAKGLVHGSITEVLECSNET